MVVILLFMVVVATILSEGIFLQPSNLTTVLFQASVLGVLAIGQAIVILSGGLDLSVGAIALLSAVIAGSMSDPTQDVIPRLPLVGAIPVALLACTAFGAVNGAFAAFTRMPMFIVTLATSLAGGSLILLIGGGNAVEPGDPFWIDFGRSTIASIPFPVFVWAGRRSRRCAMASLHILGPTGALRRQRPTGISVRWRPGGANPLPDLLPQWAPRWHRRLAVPGQDRVGRARLARS